MKPLWTSPLRSWGKDALGCDWKVVIAYLRTVMRLPLRQLQDVLRDLHGVEISLGELVELLHRITEHAQPMLEDIKASVRASPASPRGRNRME